MSDRDTAEQPSEEGSGDLARARHSLSLHLDGLRTWGIDKVFGIPVPPAPVPRVQADEPRGRAAPTTAAATSRAPANAPSQPAPGGTTAAEPPPAATPSADAPAPDAPAPDAPSADAAPLLAKVAAEVAECTACRLCEGRTKTVPGVGDPRAPILFVGEAPGRDEDLSGEPFVGKAGQLLDKIIGALGFRRDEVFIANTLKCRPPNNRDPLPDETAACTPYLDRQIAAIAPRMIVALGRPAAQFLTGEDRPLGRLRGGKHTYQGVPVIVTYHPAYLLRTPAAKADCWHDLQAVVEVFGRSPL